MDDSSSILMVDPGGIEPPCRKLKAGASTSVGGDLSLALARPPPAFRVPQPAFYLKGRNSQHVPTFQPML